MKNYIAQMIIVLLLFGSVSPMMAQTNDWSSLSSQVNSEIAVKPEKGKTVFGILTEANDDSIKIKTTKNKVVTEVSFKREEVEKVWLATLSKDSKKVLLNAGIGVAVGAGVGAGAGLIALGATGGSDDTTGILVLTTAVGAAVGAAIGGATGLFSGSKNKKNRLIFQK